LESRRQVGKLAAVAGLGAGATIAFAGSAQAASFEVTTTVDGGPGSLRQALTDANGAPGPDTITFAAGLSGQITLGSTLQPISGPVDIKGPGASVLTVSGNNANRIFDIDMGAGLGTGIPGDAVAISGLTLTGGNTPNQGGAILNRDAKLTLSRSVLSGNTAGSYGGAVYSGSGKPDAYSADLTATDSLFIGNHAGSTAGAIYFTYGSGALRNSTVTANSSAGSAVDVFEMQGPTSIENSTISGNSASNPSPGEAAGGVYIVQNWSGVTISNSTITGNTSNRSGGGVEWLNSPPGMGQPANQTPVIRNTIVAGNTALQGGPDLFTKNGGMIDTAFDLIGNPAGATLNQTVAGSNITGQDPQLAALANNGGPTPTMLPAATSPVIDKGSSAATTDQRGLKRPIDFPAFPNSAAAGANAADIGAVELQPAPGPFRFGKLKRNRRNGTAIQKVQLPPPDAGTVVLTGKGLKKQTKQATASGLLKLALKPAGKLAKKLRRRGKAKVSEVVTYTPDGGSPVSQKKKVKLLKQRRHRH